MSGFEVKPNRFTKITGYTAAEREQKPGETLAAVVKVKRKGYVPENVDVRRRIDETMFTAEFPCEALESLELDENVSSVSVSQDLKIIE